jgi:type IV secretion system protein TrbL
VSRPVVLAGPFGLPDPFGFVGGLVDGLLDVGGGVLNNVVEGAVRWLVDATLSALVDLASAILGFFWDAAEPDVTASWFAGERSTPYGDMVVLAAPLLVAFFLAGIIQGVVRGDTAGMVQMAVVRLPGAVLAMTVVIAITDVLLRATDEMSDTVLGGFRDDVEATTRLLGQVAATPGLASAGQLLLLVFGGVGLLAAVVLVIELFVRAGLIYIVVALSPLIYAAAVWEQLRGGVRKLAELGLALIISKFVIAVALSLSAAALVAAWPGEDATEIATPEQAAGGGAGGDVAQTVGLLVGAVVMFGIAAFMPFVLFRLLPIAEAAVVSQGIKAGPMRAAQQAHHTALIARHNPATSAARRHGHRGGASGAGGHGGLPVGGTGAVGASGGASAGVGGAGAAAGATGAAGAAAGPAGVAAAAVAAGATAGVKKAATSADRATSTSRSPSSSSSPESASSGSAAPSGSSRSAPSREVRQVRWGATGPGTGLEPPSGPARGSRGTATPRDPGGARR